MAVPAVVRRAMERFAGAHRARVPAVRVPRCARCRTRDRHDGLGQRGGAEAAADALGARCEGRRADGQAVSPVQRRATSSPRCRATVRAIAVLDRTKEPGAIGEPLYQDVVTAIAEARGRWHCAVHGVPARHRRALRARVEGVHAGDGQGRVRRARPPGTEARFHGRHRRRRDGLVARRG